MSMAPTDHLPVATLHILTALADGPQYGYAILKDVAERTSGEFHLGPATLYTSIKRLLQLHYIEEVPDSSGGDERRRHYRLTALGRRVAIDETRRLHSLVSQARTRLSPAVRRKRGTT
jgi:DNA-binding PadR family transcriptional regulator